MSLVSSAPASFANMPGELMRKVGENLDLNDKSAAFQVSKNFCKDLRLDPTLSKKIANTWIENKAKIAYGKVVGCPRNLECEENLQKFIEKAKKTFGEKLAKKVGCFSLSAQIHEDYEKVPVAASSCLFDHNFVEQQLVYFRGGVGERIVQQIAENVLSDLKRTCKELEELDKQNPEKLIKNYKEAHCNLKDEKNYLCIHLADRFAKEVFLEDIQCRRKDMLIKSCDDFRAF